MSIGGFEINSNKRRDPFVQDTKLLSHATLKRGVDVALPFLNLYQPAATVINVALGTSNSVVELKESYQAFSRGDWTACAKKLSMTAFLVSSVALTLLMPLVGILVTQGLSVASQIVNMGVSLYAGQYKEAGRSLLQITSSVIYIGSVFYATPELILVSLVLQAGGEIINSYREFSRGRYLETTANILLASIRLYGGKESFFTVKRNWFGKKLDQQKWEAILAKASASGKPLDVEKCLVEENISSYIQKIDAKNASLKEVVFKNIHFKECNFEQADFERARFEKVHFNDCLFEKAEFMHAIFAKTHFEECLLKEANFYQSFSKGLKISNSNLEYAVFNNSKHEGLSLDKVLLEGSCFLHSKFKGSVIKRSNLTNCILADAKRQFTYEKCSEHKMTKPVIALTWHFDNSLFYAGEIEKALKKEGALVMCFEFYPQDVDVDLLQAEVDGKLLDLDLHQKKEIFSRADYVVSNPETTTQMKILHAKTKAVTEVADAIVLSGGLDVEAGFYTHVIRDTDEDYRRSIMEFMLIKQNLDTKKPLLGTCRGSQITNVYLGGSMKDVGVQSHIKEFEYVGSDETRKQFQDLLQSDVLLGFSNHHQGMDKIGRDLEVVARDGDIPKLVVGKGDRKHILLTQFHPEFYLAVDEIKKDIDLVIQEYSNSADADELEDELVRMVELKANMDKIAEHKKFYEYFLAKTGYREAPVA